MKLQKVELVITPRRGQKRTYSFSLLSMNRTNFSFLCELLTLWERRMRASGSKPR